MYRYTVEGRGIFPFDMLRYDSAYTATGEDSSRESWKLPERKVEVFGKRKPTIERWNSFGWSVWDVRKIG